LTRGQIAAAVLAFIVTGALAGPALIPFDDIQQDRNIPFAPPGHTHWLGTDAFGRDELARLLKGTRTSLLAGSLAATVALGCGVVLGSFAGFYGRWVDDGVMGLGEFFQTVPWIYLLLGIRALLPLTLPPSAALLMIALIAGGIGWPRPARLIRGVVLSERERDYVTAARAFGATDFYLLRRHILPAIYGLLLVQAVLWVPQFVLAEVTLSFLGLGVGEPSPSLGSMLAGLRDLHVLTAYPWMLAPAGVLVLITASCQALSRRLQRRYESVH
jgi:peptide/nickel transport system permease protein